MKIVVQTVLDASVTIEDKLYSSIGRGFLILVGFTEGDNKETVERMANKLLSLRIFMDENGKTNKSLEDINGEIMSVSQFTLYADIKKGRRPSFVDALEPSRATILYDYFNKTLHDISNKDIKTGIFGADMKVKSTNDGPFTIIMDDKDLKTI